LNQKGRAKKLITHLLEKFKQINHKYKQMHANYEKLNIRKVS